MFLYMEADMSRIKFLPIGRPLEDIQKRMDTPIEPSNAPTAVLEAVLPGLSRAPSPAPNGRTPSPAPNGRAPNPAPNRKPARGLVVSRSFDSGTVGFGGLDQGRSFDSSSLDSVPGVESDNVVEMNMQGLFKNFNVMDATCYNATDKVLQEIESSF